MVLYATVIPFEIGENIQLTLPQEIIKTFIYMTEIIFLYQSLRSRNNFADKEAHLKIITVALGWSFAESLLNNLFYYLFNSMGEEFTWEYIRTAINSDFSQCANDRKNGNSCLDSNRDKIKRGKTKLWTYFIFDIV